MLREEAISKHRAMWNWIAEEIVNEERTMNICVLKQKFIERQGEDTSDMKLNYNCYLCYYTRHYCINCPLLWPSESYALQCTFGYKTANGYSEGLYKKCCMLGDRVDWQLQATLCRKIANLPEKGDE